MTHEIDFKNISAYWQQTFDISTLLQLSLLFNMELFVQILSVYS